MTMLFTKMYYSYFFTQIVWSPHLHQGSGESSDFLKVMASGAMLVKSVLPKSVCHVDFFYGIAFICSDDILGDISASRDFSKFSFLCVNISIASRDSRWVVPSYLLGENWSDISFNIWSDFYFKGKKDYFSVGNGIK